MVDRTITTYQRPGSSRWGYAAIAEFCPDLRDFGFLSEEAARAAAVEAVTAEGQSGQPTRATPVVPEFDRPAPRAHGLNAARAAFAGNIEGRDEPDNT